MSVIFLLRSEAAPRMPMLGRSPKPSSVRTYTPGTAVSTLCGSSYSSFLQGFFGDRVGGAGDALRARDLRLHGNGVELKERFVAEEGVGLRVAELRGGRWGRRWRRRCGQREERSPGQRPGPRPRGPRGKAKPASAHGPRCAGAPASSRWLGVMGPRRAVRGACRRLGTAPWVAPGGSRSLFRDRLAPRLDPPRDR
jgi:hypothetical protein